VHRAAPHAFLAAALLALAPAAARPEACPAPEAAQGGEPTRESGFNLGAFGEWFEVRRFGRVWRPVNVPQGWRPYYYGFWTWTEDGWFWVSDEPWADVTYHRGRWMYEGSNGWVWVPGKRWAPAWVTWRWTDDFIGWAPLPPQGEPFAAFWTFVPADRFVGERAEAAALPSLRNAALLARSRPKASAPGRGRQVASGDGAAR
jgi:hypothetical protein